ncbi:fasciclin domain-containing protein, partial [Streptococcus suis]
MPVSKMMMTMAFGGLAVLAVPAGVAAQTKMVGGAPMVASRTIVENASASPDLTTLVAAVKSACLVDTLSSPGPFTVFAPTN